MRASDPGLSIGLLTSLLVALAPSQPLVASGKTAFTLTSKTALTSVAELMPGIATVWKWSHGALLILEMSDPHVQTFTLVDRSGSVMSQSSFSIPGSSRVWVEGYDRDGKGSLIFCGRAYSSDGKLAPYIAIQQERGSSPTKLIQTFPYWPDLLAVAPDGSIWTVGLEMTQDRHLRGPGVNPHAHVVRHFDQSGKLIGSAIPRQTIHSLEGFYQGYLAATSNLVGWYSPINGKATYIELSSTLDSVRVFDSMTPEHGETSGFTVTDSGVVAITTVNPEKRATYILNRESSNWSEVSAPDEDSVIRGSEKDTLVAENAGGLLFLDLSTP